MDDIRYSPRFARRPTPNRADAQERWQQILEVSTDLFRRKGFVGTSMQDVSDAVGLLKGSLYYYIRSKEDLLFEILKGLHIDGEEIIASVNFDADDPIEELKTYITKASIFAGNNADKLTIFIRDFDKIPEERRKEIISEREMYTRTVMQLIEQAKAKGLASADIDVRLAATLISGAISSTHDWLRPHGRRPLEDAAREIAKLLTKGLG